MEGKKPYKSYKKTTVKAEKAPAYKPKRGKLAPLMTEEAKSTADMLCVELHGHG